MFSVYFCIFIPALQFWVLYLLKEILFWFHCYVNKLFYFDTIIESLKNLFYFILSVVSHLFQILIFIRLVWEVALFPAVFLCSFLHLISVLLSVYIHACVTSRLHVSSFPFASCISFTSWFCFHLFLRLFSSVLLSPVSCFPPVCHSPDQPSVHT